MFYLIYNLTQESENADAMLEECFLVSNHVVDAVFFFSFSTLSQKEVEDMELILEFMWLEMRTFDDRMPLFVFPRFGIGNVQAFEET